MEPEKIRELIECGKYPNLYTDISYTIFNFHENVPLLKILLENENIFEKVLFGSDFYMVESEKYSEKRFSIDLRYALGEEKFWKIANVVFFLALRASNCSTGTDMEIDGG